jgi:hypothetical protein
MAENCLECNRAYNNNSSSKRICFNDRRPTTGDHCEFSNQQIPFHQQLGEKLVSMIGWGAKLVFMIVWEAESMKSQMIDRKRWPILWSQMRISHAELVNVNAPCNWMIKDQVNHIRSPIHNSA